AAPGCVTINATPDKPIDINLNVNIRQEIVVSLRDDARELIRENPDLF
ncbi:MAG: YnbE family lipoprotein, partial [Alphaproteobacteria bacterium]|nr:YnbE family lipoprotein [Alphaproteobacteria bacterium]